jgi:hypothetical protein
VIDQSEWIINHLPNSGTSTRSTKEH